MAFPDRVKRTVEIAHPSAKVWAALTTAEGLSAWFGKEAKIDLRPGGSAWMNWDGGHTADMRVKRVEEPTVSGFTWHSYGLPEDDRRRTYCTAYDGNTRWWASSPTTSMTPPPDIEAIAEHVFVALADPS